MAEQDITIWQTNDPLKRSVTLSQERMEHAQAGHPEMAGQESAIKGVIEQPVAIYQSKSVPTCDVYFGLGAHDEYPSLYVKVVVNHASSPGAVITSHLDDELGGIDSGGLKYVNPRNRQ